MESQTVGFTDFQSYLCEKDTFVMKRVIDEML